MQNKKTRDLKRQSGFTLIEVIVSLSILALVMASLSFVSQMAIRSWESARNRSVAYNVLQDAVESIRNARDTSSTTTRDWFNADDTTVIDDAFLNVAGNPMFMELPNGFTREMSVEPRNSDVLYDGLSLNDSKRKVTVTVSWTDRGATKSLSGITYFTDWKSKY